MKKAMDINKILDEKDFTKIKKSYLTIFWEIRFNIDEIYLKLSIINNLDKLIIEVIMSKVNKLENLFYEMIAFFAFIQGKKKLSDKDFFYFEFKYIVEEFIKNRQEIIKTIGIYVDIDTESNILEHLNRVNEIFYYILLQLSKSLGLDIKMMEETNDKN